MDTSVHTTAFPFDRRLLRSQDHELASFASHDILVGADMVLLDNPLPRSIVAPSTFSGEVAIPSAASAATIFPVNHLIAPTFCGASIFSLGVFTIDTM